MSEEEWKAFILRCKKKSECPFLPRIYHMILEVLARTMKQQKERKKNAVQAVKEKLKLFLFADNITLSTCKTLLKNS